MIRRGIGHRCVTHVLLSNKYQTKDLFGAMLAEFHEHASGAFGMEKCHLGSMGSWLRIFIDERDAGIS